jgi:predicted transcriptional regulator
MTLRARVLAALSSTPQSAHRLAVALDADEASLRSTLNKLRIRGLVQRTGDVNFYRWSLHDDRK